MKTCLNCKAENSADARYCTNCRFTLDWDNVEDPTRVMDVVRPVTLDLAVGPARVQATPGAEASLEVRLRNGGGAAADVLVTVTGAAAAFGTVWPAQLSVPPGTTGEARVLLKVPSGTPPGDIDVEISAAPADLSLPAMAAHAVMTVAAAAVADPVPVPVTPQDEQVLERLRPTVRARAGRIILWSVAMAAVYAYFADADVDTDRTTLTGIVWAIGVWLLVRAVWRWRYTVTSRRVSVRRGLLRKRTVQTAPLELIERVETKGGPLQRMLGVGTVRFATAASDGSREEVTFKGVAGPDEVARLVNDARALVGPA